MSLPLRRLNAASGHKVWLFRSQSEDSSWSKWLLGRRTYDRRHSTHGVSKSKSSPFRLAVIGAGPSGFYAAGKVVEKMENAFVDMYEKLPVPFGLVRFGVAPDHPEVKNCQDKFEETASSPRFRFFGNVNVGSELPLSSLRNYYDAMLFAYGASEDKELGLPGETLPAVYSARAFVGWYNGLPEYSNLDPKLDDGEEAIIIGQGNVALDVARFLLSDVNTLQRTDVTEHALETLKSSRINRVKIVGRRGPIQAAFTIKEVRELMRLPGVAFEAFDRKLLPTDTKILPRPRRRIADLLAEGPASSTIKRSKSWSLNFLLSPISFNESSKSPATLKSLSLMKTKFTNGSNPFDPAATVENTQEIVTLPATHAFRSIGYRSAALPGLTTDLGIPFDNRTGTIPSDAFGRVLYTSAGSIHTSGVHIPGMYCSGWVKRGPTGVIASTMEDAFATAGAIIEDWNNDFEFINGNRSSGTDTKGMTSDLSGVSGVLGSQSFRPVSWEDWKRIDAAEKAQGQMRGKPREKLRTVKAMLDLLDS